MGTFGSGLNSPRGTAVSPAGGTDSLGAPIRSGANNGYTAPTSTTSTTSGGGFNGTVTGTGQNTNDPSNGGTSGTPMGVLPGLSNSSNTSTYQPGQTFGPQPTTPSQPSQLGNALGQAVSLGQAQSGTGPAFNPTFNQNVDFSYNNGGYGSTNNEQVNSNYFADQSTSNQLAQALGGKVVQGQGTGTSAGMNLIQLPNGTFINAGEAANMAKVYGGLNNPAFAQAMLSQGRTAGQATEGLTNLQGQYVPGADNADPTGAKAQNYTAVQSLYGGNTNLVNGGTNYSVNNPNEATSNAIYQLLGTNGTSNGGGNSFNPALTGAAPAYYGQSTTSPLNETSNTGTNTPASANSINPQILQLLQMLLSGGLSNTSSLSGTNQ